jgi:hypothetical protein
MFAGLTVVFSLLMWFRYRSRREMQETLRVALDKGQDLTPEIIDRLGHPKAAPDKDFRLSVIWLAIAVGLALIGFTLPVPNGEAFRGMLAGAAFPFAIGVAYMVLHFFGARKD